MALSRKMRFWLCLVLLITQISYTTQDVVTKETIKETKEEVKHLILEGEDMYQRFMTILMDAGGRYFCYSLELEPEHVLNIQYKVLLLRFV